MQTNPIPADLNGDPTRVLALADAALGHDAELQDLEMNLLYLMRVQAALRLRARLIEDEDTCGQLEAILVDSIDKGVEQLSRLVADLTQDTRSTAHRYRRPNALAPASANSSS